MKSFREYLEEAKKMKTIVVDNKEYKTSMGWDDKVKKDSAISSALKIIIIDKNLLKKLNNLDTKNYDNYYNTLKTIVKDILSNYPENGSAETKKLFKEFSKQYHNKHIGSKIIPLTSAEILKEYNGKEVRRRAIAHLKNNLEVLQDMVEVAKKAKPADEKRKEIEKKIHKNLVNKGLAKEIDKPKRGYGYEDDYEDGDEGVYGDDPEKNIKKAEKFAEKRSKGMKLSEETLKIKMLKESYDYKGVNFIENYVYSNFVKGFVNDVYDFGLNETVEFYTDLYGEETMPIYEEIADNFEVFSYITESNNGLLFEGYARLDEKMTAGGGGIGSYVATHGLSFGTKDLPQTMMLGTGTRGLAKTMSLAGNAKGLAKTADMSHTANMAGLLPAKSTLSKAATQGKGILASLWDKLKDLGKPIFNKIGNFVAAGASWAKGLLHQGMSFFTTHPLVAVAVPAVVLAGGTVAAIKLINKARKAKGKKAMNKEEVEKFKAIVKEKKPEIEKAEKLKEKVTKSKKAS